MADQAAVFSAYAGKKAEALKNAKRVWAEGSMTISEIFEAIYTTAFGHGCDFERER